MGGDNLNVIAKKRKTIGATQKDIARKIKVAQSTVAMWETGKAKPRADMLIKLAEILNCTVDELLKEETDGEGR